MNLPDKIILQLKGVDFIQTEFEDHCNCAISKAIKRTFDNPNLHVNEGVSGCYVNNKYYNHHIYDEETFDQDRNSAVRFGEDKVIRTLILF